MCLLVCDLCEYSHSLLLTYCAERMKTVRAAVASVKEEVKASSTTTEHKIRSQNRIRDAKSLSRGQARVQFEKAVRKAESELMKLHYSHQTRK